jgi:hypothetical protein
LSGSVPQTRQPGPAETYNNYIPIIQHAGKGKKYPDCYRISVDGVEMSNPIVTIYKRFPEKTRKKISDHLSFLKKIARYGFELRFRVYDDLEQKRFVYVTSAGVDTNFIEGIYPGATVTRVDTIYAWNLRKFVRRHDNVIIDMHSFFARFFTDGIFSVCCVRQIYDLTRPFEELFCNKDMKRERKKAEQFQPCFSKDLKDLDFFYETMYLPFVQRRHDDAIILKKVFLQQYLEKNGELCLLKKDGTIVGGQFCNLTGETFFMLVLGLIDECYLKEGASAALYYYCIQRALEKKARYVDFGLAQPFIFDGVVGYKKKWGGRIHPDHESGRVMYLKNIKRNGLIILEDTKLKVMVSEGNVVCRELAADMGMEVKVI